MRRYELWQDARPRCCSATPQIPSSCTRLNVWSPPSTCVHVRFSRPAFTYGLLQEIEMEVQRQQVHNRALSSQLAEAAAALREADSRVRSAARTPPLRLCVSAV